MNIPIIVSYIYRNSASKAFATDMSSFSQMNATWVDQVNAAPTMQALITNEVAAMAWWNASNIPPVTAFLASFGYDAIALINLSDIQIRLHAASIPLPTKTAEIRQWITATQIAYATSQPFTNAPHTYAEVLTELAPYLELIQA